MITQTVRNYGFGTTILSQATHLWQAKNYSGSGDWLDEKASSNFQFGSSSGADTNDPLWLPHSTSQNPFGAGVDYVSLPGIAGNNVTTSDTAALDITGDITMVACIAPNDWTPGSVVFLVHKWVTGTQQSYSFRLLTNGVLRVSTSPDGSSTVTGESTAAVGASDGTRRWVAASLDVDNGAGNRVYKFWTSTDGSSWTQLGSTVTTAGTTSIFAGTATLEITASSSNYFTGSYARAQVYSGVRDFSGTPSGGTLVADFNPNGGTVNSTQTTLTGTGDGLTWTFNRASTGRKLAVVDEDKFLLGTDDYFQTPDVATLNFGTGDFTIVVTVRNFVVTGAGANGYFFSKRDNSGTNIGWELVDVKNSTANSTRLAIDEGANVDIADSVARTAGERYVNTGTRNSTELVEYLNTTAGTPGASNSYNPDSSVRVTIGLRAANSTQYDDIEVMSAVVFKGKALTSAEVAQLVSELS